MFAGKDDACSGTLSGILEAGHKVPQTGRRDAMAGATWQRSCVSCSALPGRPDKAATPEVLEEIPREGLGEEGKAQHPHVAPMTYKRW